MENKNLNCSAVEVKLADLLLDPAALPAKVLDHVAACHHCSAEFGQLRATMNLLDTWEAPEPSPYFLTRLNAQMREERQAAPEGWFALLRDRLAYGPATHLRPLAAMALTVVLLVGGGAYLGITDWNQTAAPPNETAVVHDLQTLDSNAQLLDQLEALSTTDNGD